MKYPSPSAKVKDKVLVFPFCNGTVNEVICRSGERLMKGHAGSHMSIPHEPDEVCKHLPARCALCPHLSECLVYGKVFSCVEKRYVKAVRTKVLNLLNFLSVDFGTSEISCFVFLSYYSLRICLLRFLLLSECCDQCTTQ